MDEGCESARKADSNTPMAGWRRSAGRRVLHRITASSAASPDGADWGGQAALAARPANVGRDIQGTLAMRGRSRAVRHGGTAPGVFNGALGVKGEP